MQEDHLLELINKYIDQTASSAEVEELQAWYRSVDHSNVEWPGKSPQEEQRIDDKILRSLLTQIAPPSQLKALRPKRRWPAVAAAATLLLIGGSYAIWQRSHADHQQVAATVTPAAIPPGTNKATLTLADGSTLQLDDTRDGALKQEGGTLVSKQQAQLVYNITSNETIAAGTNTLSTPIGGQFQVVLPDGTKVWLNAASTLKYPTAFTEAERNVTLTGEAYFEVAPDKGKAFVVKTPEMNVQVLGTHFNVMAYANEKSVKTTLLQGAVRLVKGTQTALLKPGQQGNLGKDASTFTVMPATDPDAAIAWKNGYFSFDQTELEAVMRQISRWYNIEVVYKGDVKHKTLEGKMPNSYNLSQVLLLLKKTTDIDFKLEGRILTITP